MQNTEISESEPSSDQQLLTRFIDMRDADAFAEIVRRHQKLVYRLARRIAGNETDADDIFQAAFMALAQCPRSLRRSESLGSWLYTVTWRIAWKFVRRRPRTTAALPDERLAEEAEDPLDRIARQQEFLILDEELHRLPQRYRDVLILSYFSEHSHHEIAELLCVTKAVVDGRIHRARQLLRVRLARRSVGLGALAAAVSFGREAPGAPSIEPIQAGFGTESSAGPFAPDFVPKPSLLTLIPSENLLMNTRMIAVGIVGSAALLYSVTTGFFGASSTAEAGRGGLFARSPIQAAAPATQEAANTGSEPVAFMTLTAPETRDEGAAFVPIPRYAEGAGETEMLLYEVLRLPARTVDEDRLTLRDALTLLFLDINGGDASEEPRVRIVADLPRLEDNGIASLDEIELRGLRFGAGMTIEQALDLMFDAVPGQDVDYLIHNNVLLVTSSDAAESPRYMQTRVYPVSDLLALQYHTPAGSRTGGQGGAEGGSGGYPGGGGVGGMGVGGMGVGGMEAGGGGVGGMEAGGMEAGGGGVGGMEAGGMGAGGGGVGGGGVGGMGVGGMEAGGMEAGGMEAGGGGVGGMEAGGMGAGGMGVGGMGVGGMGVGGMGVGGMGVGGMGVGGMGAGGMGAGGMGVGGMGVGGMGAPGMGAGMGGGYVSPVYSLEELVREMTSPAAGWFSEGLGEGVIRTVGDNLVVKQSFRGHRAVIELLNTLRRDMK